MLKLPQPATIKMDANYRSMVINNGFGPQLRGDETIAELFDSCTGCLTEEDRKEKAVRASLDPKLMRQIQEFNTKLSKKTPIHKYEILILWLEHRITDITVKQQIKSKRFYKVLRNDAVMEEDEGVRGVSFPGSIIPKSSLMGRDPFGDKPLPAACYEPVEEAAEGDGANEEGGAAEGARREYSEVGLLVKAIQEQNLACIKVLIYELVDKDLEHALRKRESEYRRSEALRSTAPRGEMPWSEYKEIIVRKIKRTIG